MGMSHDGMEPDVVTATPSFARWPANNGRWETKPGTHFRALDSLTALDVLFNHFSLHFFIVPAFAMKWFPKKCSDVPSLNHEKTAQLTSS